jgi:hypothetical protein
MKTRKKEILLEKRKTLGGKIPILGDISTIVIPTPGGSENDSSVVQTVFSVTIVELQIV